MEQQDNFTPKIRLKLLVLTICSFTTLVLAALLVIMLSLQSFTGFASTAPFVLGTCSAAYYSTKYNDINKILMVIFITAVISIFLQIAISILVFSPLVMKVVPTQTRIAIIYILTSLHMLSIIIGFSKFLSFQIEFNSMGSTCTMQFSQILVTILLAISCASILLSLAQYVCLLVVAEEVSFEQTNEQTYVYKQIWNMTNNTLQNIEDPLKNAHTKKTQKHSPYRVAEDQSKRQKAKEEDERFDSNNQIIAKAPKPMLQRESPIQPKYNRENSIRQEEESFKSILRHQKLALGRMVNNPGPITGAHNMQESDRAYRPQGYLSYIRKMNSNHTNQPSDKQAELIATIRGKYSK